MMKQNRVYIVIIVVLISVLVVVQIHRFYKDNQLEISSVLTNGKITSCSTNSKGSPGYVYVDFTYRVNGEAINGTYMSTSDLLSCYDCNGNFLGKTFPAIYQPGCLKNATLLITPHDFKKYGYYFPDTLKWVLNYIKEK